MKGMNRLGTAAVLAGLVAFGLGLSSARLEAKGNGNGNGGGDISAVCSTLLSVINNTSLPEALRNVAQAGYDILGCGN